MLGCFLYVIFYRCISERVIFPLCYLMYIASIVLYYLNKHSSIASILRYFISLSLGRCLQGVSIGILIPWTLHVKFDLATSSNRFQLSFLTFVTLIGCHFMGYLLRLVGNTLEINIFSGITLFLCLLGCLTAFSVITPSRLLYKNHKNLKKETQSDTPLMSDDMITTLSQTIEAYYYRDQDYVLESFLLLFSIEANDFEEPGKRFVSTLRKSWLLWIFSLLTLTVKFDLILSSRHFPP